jgi:hypothetical protein
LINPGRIPAVNETTHTASHRAPSSKPARIAAYWIIGVTLALTGALVARFVAPGLAETHRAIISVAGHLAAGAGLLVIAIGVRNRLRVAGAAASSGADVADDTASGNLPADPEKPSPQHP